jgi:hypothetical protein
MKMTKAMWRELDFKYDFQVKCWRTTKSTLSFEPNEPFHAVVRALIENARRQAEWLGKNEVRSAMRQALGL